MWRHETHPKFGQLFTKRQEAMSQQTAVSTIMQRRNLAKFNSQFGTPFSKNPFQRTSLEHCGLSSRFDRISTLTAGICDRMKVEIIYLLLKKYGPQLQFKLYKKGKGKPIPLQAWSGPEGSRKLRFPDFMTTAQDGGKF